MPMPLPPVHFSIDVECVATGTGHHDRDVAQIGLVDEHENVLLNVFVAPEKEVVSYLTPLTGLTKEMIAQYGVPLPQAMELVRRHLPKHAVLVGQVRTVVSWSFLLRCVPLPAGSAVVVQVAAASRPVHTGLLQLRQAMTRGRRLLPVCRRILPRTCSGWSWKRAKTLPAWWTSAGVGACTTKSTEAVRPTSALSNRRSIRWRLPAADASPWHVLSLTDSYFSLGHEAKVLIGVTQDTQHNAVTDAIISVRLFNLYQAVSAGR